ncbi:indole-3-glycerol phosphate synthase TrpC [Clostridium algidicarnis]|uniref:Indole-3-glycerol phosphate synthase n=1 Tax=Clostridium algidicarnis DSM 15099 TaxID=1121295 RepID=A0A2S6G0A6_9CLOT|nr:indole-3-glycerol phosphate synthase TrpC [Clostridium algidicarnis]MBB6630740.1 indole-3-glycerol phosphate synthase TrpC [Clostridium algidicarnis]MBB6696569.1 indole-3-glycerol phosphate synthase TrpC [Clostridium algidicarnis]MBU3228728.1 indole-3-glycerol phosphate synthase TrpC [Clostridium algidicarnis]MBU3252272.1 indole-3-glycerol phosphate synthase TrpC [Clostridium algidicarnis]PPK49359.1 indole-3-glycerol phosphate synthase [Clostridium algidicarnis DSM 15099]
MILDKIVSSRRKRLEIEKSIMSIEDLKKQITNVDTRDFKRAIKRNGRLNIIGEVKKASPSKGIIREDFNPADISRIYDENKIDAISVLTEEEFFLGNGEYLSLVKKETRVPILRKDFIIDLYQIYQSKFLGADAILLIGALLTKKQLVEFQKVAKDINLQCLVEVHNLKELEKVLETSANIIGINNRNLNTFKVDIETTEKLIHHLPKDIVVVSESGISKRKDMKYLEDAGVDGVLIGEAFMNTISIKDKIKELRGE